MHFRWGDDWQQTVTLAKIISELEGVNLDYFEIDPSIFHKYDQMEKTALKVKQMVADKTRSRE